MLTERESQESSANDGVFPPQLFEDEVEVAPGIYLIKRKAPLPSDPLSLPLPTAASSTAGSVAGGVMHGIVTQSDNLEFLMQEADRLKNSVNLLLRTNDELRQYDSSDSVFQEAIRENIVVVDRQMRMIKSITERSQQLLGQMEAAGCLDAPM
ncbi:hypothetical protein BASA81_013079 [Batrachochytrium salamandrivorans]|nr:hypothetical protein BASA81_013079 [Batrachochytrium salamandrivorans]